MSVFVRRYFLFFKMDELDEKHKPLAILQPEIMSSEELIRHLIEVNFLHITILFSFTSTHYRLEIKIIFV